MKYLLGTLTTAIILFLTLYGVLRIYDIALFDPELFQKLLLTLGIVLVISFLLTILLPFFFRNHFKGYDRTKGTIAHPKNSTN